ncbi:MAG: substrate-binding domain-containing protein [Acidobacteria bacterium]|nr:substrate-binding domain-containing protein [Acidobacteriota bacterium]MBI3279516.1 substrate-binding domain-containing protein [Acidobacteriota bacterium]
MLSRRRACVLAGAVLAAACRRRQRKTIAVIPKGTSHVFWLSVEQGALAAGKEFNVDILWNGPVQETEYTRQMQILDSMISRHVDGIAVAAAERKALLSSIDRAASEGIPLTVFDSGVDTTNYLSYVATDNLEGGRLGARTLAGLLKGKGKVAMIMHAPGSASTMDRERGFTEVIEKEFPGIRIAATQFGMSDRAKALAAAENILNAHPDLNGMFASSEPSSVGCALAIKSRGLEDKVALAAFDSSESMIADLRRGAIDAMVVQDPYRMGYEAVKTVVDKLNGRQPPKQIDLPARVVRREDLDKPEIRRLLMMK